jgi:8-oxo-dGTP pyrophosphatase MutT (NUDIX family)
MMPLFQRALPWTRNVHVRSAETRTLLDRLERHLQTLPLRTVQVEHDPSIAVPNAAVLILLCRSLVTNGCQGRDELAFVLTERSKLVRIHRGEISCPGGKVRKGDGSLLQTALRETQEEIGLDPRFVRVLGKFHEYRPLLRSSNFRVLSFIGYMDDRVDPRNLSVNPAEVQNLFVIPRLTLEAFRSDSGCCDWAKDQHEIELGHANDQSSTHDDLHDSVPAQSSSEVPQDRRQRQGGERDVDPTPAPMYCLPREFTGGKIVWGMTARIIHDVLLLIHQCEQQSDSRE